ncbi:adhesion G-protein coupled receptor G2-like [Physella acuta]|uniref:adhesion G-protein coupled receptor G2-like n=1 Tax=Physella acuta TaxID=109671 RepID=UPI0027DB42C0|nr:adhesion G-protein coupled receptor G2-like [Physella acuta]
MVWEDSYVGESTHLNISADGWLKTFSRKCIQENLVPKWSSLTIKITNGTTDTTLPTMEPLGITTFPPATAASMLINASLLAHDLHQSRHMSNEDYERTIEQLEDLCQDESLAVPGVSRAMVFCLNELLVHHKEHLSAEGGFNKQRLLDVIEKVAERTPLTNGSFKYVEKLLAVSGFRLPSDTTGELVMSISGFLSTGDLTAGNLDIEIKKNISTESTSINIPLTSVSASVKEGRIVFIVHATEELFVTQNYSDQYIVKPILSAIISGAQVNLVDERILITLLHADKGTHQPSCVYWNRSDSGELGQWSTEGCELVSSSENKTICACNHLTNFGLLMDIYEVKASISEAHLERLSIITIAGSMISFCCLLLTIFNYTIFSNLRKNTPSKIVYNLCWALMLFNGFFLLGHFTTDVIEDNSSCKAMAALLHYSLLAAMFWMSVNAFFMYISVVKVFNIQIAYFFLKCFLFAWGLPAIFVGITLLLNESKNYGKINTEFCWIKKPAFYVTLVSPISVSLALNVYVFCLTMREVSKSNRRHSSLMIGEDRNFRVNLRAAFSLLILLGLTWIFAFFTFGQLGTLFSYLFSIFNSLQGMFIFTFYCLLKRDVLNAWMVLFGYKTNEIIFSSAFSESSRSSLRKHSKGDDYRFSESLEKEVPADIQEDGTAIN